MINKQELFSKLGMKYGVALAPMAGFTDRAMRAVCRAHGAEYSVTEMVSAKALDYGDKKTFKLAKILPDEGRCAVQIFGSEPDVMARAAVALSKPIEDGTAPVAIDVNMGCPVHKIFSNGEGSALMKNPELVGKIVKSITDAIEIPCTVKIRTGIDKDTISAVECAKAAEENGAALLTVHGRTRVQMYSGEVDRETIAKVKRAVKIPVLANGDVTDAKSALEMLKVTGADGVMIGRGAVGNPFIFEEIKAALAKENYTPPTPRERIECALLQLRLAIEEKGEDVAVRESRKQIALYLHSFRGAASLRARINTALTYADVCAAFAACKGESLEND